MVCPKGYYCPIGTFTDLTGSQLGYVQPCSIGYYNDQENKGTCKLCEAGFECSEMGMSNGRACSKGTYRPYGTTYTICQKCDSGTYLNNTKAQKKEDCKKCPAGLICLAAGIGDLDQGKKDGNIVQCKQGYYCPEGTSKETQTNHPCKAKYVCPPGMLDDPS